MRSPSAVCPRGGSGETSGASSLQSAVFEAAVADADHRSVFHRLRDAVLVLKLVLATNPHTVRSAVLRCSNMRVFVSRAIIERRYAPATHAAGHA